MKFPNLPAAGALTGSEIVPVTQGGVDKRTTTQAIADLAAAGAVAYTIVTEATAFTADPGMHDGLARLVLAGGDVTFSNAEPYVAGMVFNLIATASLDLVESSVTLTPPAGGTLGMDADMAAQVVMTSATTGRVIGQTVAAP